MKYQQALRNTDIVPVYRYLFPSFFCLSFRQPRPLNPPPPYSFSLSRYLGCALSYLIFTFSLSMTPTKVSQMQVRAWLGQACQAS